MEHTIPFQTAEAESIYLASRIFQDVNETLQRVHAIAAALLRYAELGASIANTLIEWNAASTGNEI